MYGERELEAFVAVLDCGSVSLAAERLIRTQPTVSRQIASLERQVGAALFRRMPQGMVTTYAGERLEPMARDLVRRGRRAREVMSGIVQNERSFVAAAPEMTSVLVLAPFIARGGPISDVVVATPAETYDRLRSGADLAVTTSPPDSRLRSRRILDLPLYCQLPSDHPLAAGDAVELRDLLAGPFLTSGVGSAAWTQIQRAAEGEAWSLEMASFGADAPIVQARSAAGHGPCVVVEPPRFGLLSKPLLHRGTPMQCALYASWERAHYARDDIRAVIDELAAFVADHVSGLHEKAALRAL
ncbi:LysR family transcriptional regulator [Microbacterium sp. LWO14-1.2]|jgi:DNA-binding transcriptional LysR family regulator|uniref:LysR family transcriptional regulator n=1 Tax=unclassified Microbacterium TaxID=2609290 RepID=UPI00313871F1